LNHGTSNSSDNADLVISKLKTLLAGAEGSDWIYNEGAGTTELFARNDVNKGKRGLLAKTANAASGIVAGKGVEANVTRAVQFVAGELAISPTGVTVNMVGHSRGSITCYKIARELREQQATTNVPVNIFAIDPVPGNMGTLNQANYKNIALGGNLQNTVLMLAESEHRLAFRPYVDALYSMGLDDHKLETMPGSHGGINELTGDEKEAAQIVMSRAVEFLEAHNAWLKQAADVWKLSPSAKLERYAKMMRKIKKYTRHSTLWNPANFFLGGAQVDRQRTAVVHGAKDTWGDGNAPVLGATDAGADQRRRGDHRGLKLNEVLQRGNTLPAYQAVHSMRPNRFFANLEHQAMFTTAYPTIIANVLRLERGVDKDRLKAIATELPERWQQESATMSMPEREYGARWLEKRGCPVVVH
jgi:hypothetical protein